MAKITDTPTAVTTAGQAHEYTGGNNSRVTLVSAPVPRDLSVFARTQAAYDNYIAAEIAAGRAWERDIQVADPRAGLALDIPLLTAARYNYARVVSGSARWYMFIDRVEWGANNTTRVYLTTDPAATYPGWSLGYSFVERSHAPVAASQNDTYGDRYCLAPEPISAPPAVGVASAAVLDSLSTGWTVRVVSANDLRGNGSSVPFFGLHVENDELKLTKTLAYNAGVSPVGQGDDNFYPTGGGDHGFSENLYDVSFPWSNGEDNYVPEVKPSNVSLIDGVPQGGGVFLFTPAGWATYANIMQSAPWVLEGIISFAIVPAWSVNGGGGGAPVATAPPTQATDPRWSAVAAIPNYVESLTSQTITVEALAGWRDTYLASMGAGIFRKLVTSQFTKISVGNGESMTDYDPEGMQSNGVVVRAVTGAAHGENSIRLTVDYNDLTNQKATSVPYGGSVGLMASGFGRAASNTASADLGPLNAAFTNHSSRQTMEYNYALAKEIGVDQAQMNAGIIGVQSVLQAGGGAALAGMAGGGPVGAAVGALVGGATAAITAGVSSNASLDILDASRVGSMDIGTYQLAVNGQFNAMSFRTWVQGLKSVSGSGSGTSLASGWRAVKGDAFEVILVVPQYDRARELISTWRRYGYMVNRAFTPPQLNAMSKYSYWKTSGAVITGPMTHDDRERIAAAFDAGVTIYESLFDIGNDVSTTNTPVAGYTY